MAQTWEARRLRHERSMDRRLIEEQRGLARAIVPLLLRAAQPSPDGPIIPNTRSARARLKAAIWSDVLKPYFVGRGDEPFDDINPRSPYALLLREGVEGALRIQAQRQAALVNSLVRDETVVQWLTGPRRFAPAREQRGVYDPFHTWVDPNGYRLSDRIWQAAINERAAIDGMLSYHIAQGTSAVRMAELLEPYLTQSAAASRTRTPYGRSGSYAARRLARTEIAAASGRGLVNAAIANPFVEGVQWRLSPNHPRTDICDGHARGGPNGDGVYQPDLAPPFPAHPLCMCHLLPITVGDVAQVTTGLRRDIAQRRPRALALQGILNPTYLVNAILSGSIHEAIDGLLRALRGEEAARFAVGGG